MLKRISVLIVVSLLIVSSLLSSGFGCSAPKPTPAPAPTSTPTSTPTSAPTPTVKPIELKLAANVALTHMINTGMWVPFVNEVQKRSGGRVKVTIYPPDTLGKIPAYLDILNGRVVDIAAIGPSQYAGRFPLTTIADLPLAFSPTGEIGTRLMLDMVNAGAFGKELADFKIPMVVCSSSYYIMSTKEIRSLADIKGLKMRSPGGYSTPTLEAFGTSPIYMATSEMMPAVERGLLQGSYITLASAASWKLDAYIKSVVDLPLSASVTYLSMNKDSWNSLPPDIQKIMNDVGAEINGGKVFDDQDKPAREAAEKAGKIYTLTPAEEESALNALKPVFAQWLADMDAKGLPGKNTLDQLISLREKQGLGPLPK